MIQPSADGCKPEPPPGHRPAAVDLILVDGSYHLFRAYHAISGIHSSAGFPTNAILGVTNLLRSLLREYQPERMAVVFDPRGKTFRNTIDAGYKSNRPRTPEDLVCQIEPLQCAIRAMGLALLCIDGEEADDVLATLARQADRAGLQTLIATGDKDLSQLVNERIRLIDAKGRLLDGAAVQDKFGVPPERMVDYLALVGDAVDNIAGVPLVGPKTAIAWLHKFGDLDAIIKAAAGLKGKAGANLRDSLSRLPTTRQLVSLRDQLQLPLGLDDLVPSPLDRKALEPLLQRWEFSRWLQTLREGPAASDSAVTGASTPAPLRPELLCEEVALRRWLQRLADADLYAIQVQTRDPKDSRSGLVGIAFAVDNAAAYLPLGHTTVSRRGMPIRETLQRLQPLLEDVSGRLAGHDLKHSMNALHGYGIRLRGTAFDSMLESYVHNSTAAHELSALCTRYLDRTPPPLDSVVGKGAQRISFDQVELDSAAAYAGSSALLSLRLHQQLWPQLCVHPQLRKVFEDMEMPLLPVLSQMECNGVLIDPGRLAAQGRELSAQLAVLQEQARALAGTAFNLSSPRQIQQVLFDPDQLGLDIQERTPGGEPSTAESALQKLIGEHELPGLILQHRMLNKLKNTYTDKLPNCIRTDSGRVHTVYHQAVASTGRLSSSAPNLQNIPIRTPAGQRIRQAFIAPPGHVLLTADYSQIELRIMAHLSGDARLCAAFKNGEDVHSSTAAEIFKLAPQQISTEQRRTAKAINFGLIYGMSAYGLARQLDIGLEQAQQYMQRYFARYSGVQEYMQRIRTAARAQGYVETLYGRRLYLPELRSANGARRQAAERAAINAPMQGTAADLVKYAMIQLHQWLEADQHRIRMVMQVHDELVFEVPEARSAELCDTVRHIMEGSGQLEVPLKVTLGCGGDWEAAH